MTRGRPRKADPTIPRHIDQKKLPPGAYWDSRDRVWYTKLGDSGKRNQRRRIAGPDATLAQLYRVIDEIGSSTKGGTIAWLHNELMAHIDWKKLKPNTQRDYEYSLKALGRMKTSLGVTADQLIVNRLRKVDVQTLVDEIAKTRPSSANHVKRYLGRLFAWGMQRGKINDRTNPAHDVKQADEVGKKGMPVHEVMDDVIAYARERGARQARTEGSCPPYIWIIMAIAYRCRLRGVEVMMLTDADKLEEGLLGVRRKGSLDTITTWSPELVEAWDAAVAVRKRVFEKLSAKKGYVVPLLAKDRPLLVSEKGMPLVKLDAEGNPEDRTTLDSAWQRFMRMAIKDGVLTKEQRFTLHGLKHRGVTDTEGGKAAKKEVSGHKTDAMAALYDHEVPVVAPAKRRQK